MRRTLLPACLLGLGLAALAAAPTPAADAAEIRKFIDQLGSGSFDEREKATAALDAVGEPALAGLRKAMESDDAEVRRRAEELVQKIEKRVESSRVLVPTKVKLAFKDVPLYDAIGELRKQSGYNIQLHDPEGKLKDYKVTLDTGETTFWQAFDQFCASANLVEAGPEAQAPPAGAPARGGLRGPIRGVPVPLPAPVPAPPVPDGVPPGPDGAALLEIAPALRIAIAAPDELPPGVPVPAPVPGPVPVIPPPRVGGGVILGGGFGVQAGMPAVSAAPLGTIYLRMGKPPILPTAYVGALRIRALQSPGIAGTADHLVLNLQISPEPKLQWQSLLGARIDRAVDQQGQLLASLDAAAPGAEPPALARGRRAAQPNAGGILHQYVQVPLKKGEKASKALKEASGSIAARVLTAPSNAISANDVLKAAGKTFKGKDGGSIKVIEATKDETGRVKVRFEFEQPADMMPASLPGTTPPPTPRPAGARLMPTAPPLPGGGVLLPPGAPGIEVITDATGAVWFGNPNANAGTNGLSLLDDKGNPLSQVGMSMTLRTPPRGTHREYTLVFQTQKGQEAAQLVFTGRKVVNVDVPFTLKDIVLE